MQVGTISPDLWNTKAYYICAAGCPGIASGGSRTCVFGTTTCQASFQLIPKNGGLVSIAIWSPIPFEVVDENNLAAEH